MEPPAGNSKASWRIHVRGIVQGVGFRPFVYNLAGSLDLAGFVLNSSFGVAIEIEGSAANAGRFLAALESKPPLLAEITELTVREIAALGAGCFEIRESRDESGEFALVSPVAGTCEACWRDFGDSSNWRFGYPFTNCTHCGPRYTIIHDMPYDRAKTSMRGFTMCRACLAEYEDPANRRFHAQPNACAVCGPSLCLAPSGSSVDARSFIQKDPLPAIRQARQYLRDGGILAVKGLGGFLVACDAANAAAVAELRARKRRPAKRFALMVRDLQAIRSLCAVTAEDEVSLQHPRRPIVVLPRVSFESGGLPRGLAPGNNTLGCMPPYTPLHYLLFSDSPDAPLEFAALVMTSGNLAEEPLAMSNSEALSRLSGIADWFLLHSRDIVTRVDDSIVRSFEGRPRVLRRSRGFAPQTLHLGYDLAQVLAVGGRVEESFLPDARHTRDSEPAHWRSRKLRDNVFF